MTGSNHRSRGSGRSTPIRGVPAADRYSLRQVAVPGGTLAFGVWEAISQPAKVTVVAVHGITGNHRCWPYLVEQLPDLRFVAPDLRGRGGSAQIEGPFGMARHADDIVAVLDAVEVASAVIVGHSMGGSVALVTADQHPDRVRSIILVDGGLPLGGDSRRDSEADVEQITARLSQRLATTFPTEESGLEFWRRHPAFEQAWSTVVEDYARYDLGGRRPMLRSRATEASMRADSQDVGDGADLQGALMRLRHPTLWLLAARGLLNEVPPLYPQSAVLYWREAYPQIAIKPVSDVNHYTIVMSSKGGEAIAAAVSDVVG